MSLNTLVDQWTAWDFDPKRAAEVRQRAVENPKAVLAAMHPRISFGTAGLRAEMGPGFALMNTLTVAQASQGLAVYTKNNVNDAVNRGVVIGHDHRHHSLEFALETAKAFAHLGFRILFLGQVHTPLVPYGIKKFNAACGVMITASHNPAKDNGYKVYWENACQIIPPHDEGIAEEIERQLVPWNGTEPQLTAIDLLDEYTIDVLKPLGEITSGTDLKVVYTPMHGVGLKPALKVFKELHIKPIVVLEQQEPDPDFPTVAFPNPEELGALDLAMRYGTEHDAQLIVANDPDADRFSCAVRVSNGGWQQLTGDQIGTLFANYILSRHKNTGKVAVVNSTVSSQQLRAVAELHNASYFETLTGFKWIGNKAIELETKGYTVPFAYEEAIGYMLGPIKDKDGISALHVFLQLFAALKRPAMEEIESISQKTGFFATHNSYYTVKSSQGMASAFAKIRDQIGQGLDLEDLKVSTFRDLTKGYDSQTIDHKPLLPVSSSSEMVTVELTGSSGLARVTARGSGTEPKLKVYIEGTDSTEEAAKLLADHVWDVLKRCWFDELD